MLGMFASTGKIGVKCVLSVRCRKSLLRTLCKHFAADSIEEAPLGACSLQRLGRVKPILSVHPQTNRALNFREQCRWSAKYLAHWSRQLYNRAPVVGVAQLVELRIVIPAVAGSNPVVHPS